MSRILHLLALIALVLTPMTMHRAEATPAAPRHHEASANGHCGGSEQAPADRDQSRGADCALACSAMPGSGARIEPTAMPRAAYTPLPITFFAGTAPGSDPPPPRLS